MGSSKVGYFTFNEKPWSNLLRRQVIEVIFQSNRLTNKDIILVSFLPFYEYLRNRSKISNLNRELQEENIRFITIPTPFPIPIYTRDKGWTNRWRYDWIRMVVVLLYSIPFILYLEIREGINTFHCRSYPISISVLTIKYINKDIRLIFDPRSDFPEENITRGNWSKKSLSYKMWKKLEKQLCIHSDYVIAISNTYDQHYRDIYNDVKTKIIPNNVNTSEFSPEKIRDRSIRENHNIDDSTTLICYSGSMYKSLWNNPDEYGCVIEKLLETNYNLKFLFLIPPDSNGLLRRKLKEYSISRKNYIIKNPDFEQVPTLLSQADLGLYILDNASIRIGTKFVEYCSAGLPTIVNQNVEGAAEIIHKNNLGCEISLHFNKNDSYCPSEPLSKDNLKQIGEVISNKKEISENCRQFAKENFDTTKIANSYADIY
ncbi:glycosyltransferase involved in cell wall biosynthesis [Halorubrum alkaliphilum]|uniref:Glycosyltransferase involved in cell wall biosynthesis n=1 Tax=Halorubrum alkaliphilum TaxID=261290 RepID=A0A8T4GK45_9EURY|nr:hypothetical protein [Halorubrum alkaliphilum]MBP1924077.1 glycosyltransferase involved in cell wall biosynthesis [Halorubrum alkaliphilum]